MAVMTDLQFRRMALYAAEKCKTLYILGCFGSPMNAKNKARYTSNYEYNTRPARRQKILAASADTFGFDCVCLIKGILWGWYGNVNDEYGGAVYKSNGVPDVGADEIMNLCSGVSTNFSNIQVGELVHMKGHVGIYIGDGLAVECTPNWKDGVQITAVWNIAKKAGYNGRSWTDHGKLRFIDYTQPAPKPATNKYTFDVSKVEKGDTGASVLLCQKLLRIDGYKDENGHVLQLDGECGAHTVAAINSFQTAMRKKGIECGTNGKNDGICGQKCWKALLGL